MLMAATNTQDSVVVPSAGSKTPLKLAAAVLPAGHDGSNNSVAATNNLNLPYTHSHHLNNGLSSAAAAFDALRATPIPNNAVSAMPFPVPTQLFPANDLLTQWQLLMLQYRLGWCLSQAAALQPPTPNPNVDTSSIATASSTLSSPSFSVDSLLQSPVKVKKSPPTAASVKQEPIIVASPPDRERVRSSSSLSSNNTASSHFQEGVTIGYTYDALFATDGRSKRRLTSPILKDEHESSTGSVHSSQNNGNNAQQQRYTCQQCGKSYATSSNLSRHKQTHRSLDSVHAKKCPECGKTYVSMPALSMHILTHKLQHKCDICGKAFSRPWLLHGHLRSHTGQKPFGCAHCGKAFADRSNLRAHMQTHSGTKRHECEKCGKSFALKSYLTKHQESACPNRPLTSTDVPYDLSIPN